MNEQESGGGETGPRPDLAPAISLRRRVLSLPTLLSFVVAAAFVFFLATRFELDWGVTWQNLRSMDLRFYALALALYYVSFSFRGLRWRLLAKNAGLEDRPGTRLPSALRCASLIVAGWFVNSIAWLRLGDAYRAYLFSEESRAGFSWSLGTVLAERMMDMATVAAVLAVSVLALALTADAPERWEPGLQGRRGRCRDDGRACRAEHRHEGVRRTAGEAAAPAARGGLSELP